MSKQIVIIGAGGHGKVVADIVMLSGDTVLGFLDDGKAPGETVCGIPVLGPVSAYVHFPDAWFLVAVGDGTLRERLVSRMNGVKWHMAIHPTAVISPMETEIGEGTVVMANAVVNPCARIGSHCIINTGAIVEHDNEIGNFSHISVGAKLGGTVKIGEKTWVGIGAAIKNNVTVCGDCVIGAGAVVVRDITVPGTYTGTPARKIK